MVLPPTVRVVVVVTPEPLVVATEWVTVGPPVLCAAVPGAAAWPPVPAAAGAVAGRGWRGVAVRERGRGGAGADDERRRAPGRHPPHLAQAGLARRGRARRRRRAPAAAQRYPAAAVFLIRIHVCVLSGSHAPGPAWHCPAWLGSDEATVRETCEPLTSQPATAVLIVLTSDSA